MLKNYFYPLNRYTLGVTMTMANRAMAQPQLIGSPRLCKAQKARRSHEQLAGLLIAWHGQPLMWQHPLFTSLSSSRLQETLQVLPIQVTEIHVLYEILLHRQNVICGMFNTATRLKFVAPRYLRSEPQPQSHHGALCYDLCWNENWRKYSAGSCDQDSSGKLCMCADRGTLKFRHVVFSTALFRAECIYVFRSEYMYGCNIIYILKQSNTCRLIFISFAICAPVRASSQST